MSTKLRKSIVTALSFVLMLTCVIGLGPQDTYAASKAPAKVDLKSVGYTDGTAILKWKFMKNVSGYQIYRKDEGAGWRQVKVVKEKAAKNNLMKDQETVLVTATGLESEKTYCFKVRAYAKSGNKYKYGKFSKSFEGTTKNTEKARKKILKTINKKIKTGKLERDPDLDVIAQKWANKMAKKVKYNGYELAVMKTDAYDEADNMYYDRYQDYHYDVSTYYAVNIANLGSALERYLDLKTSYYFDTTVGGYDYAGIGYKNGYVAIIVSDIYDCLKYKDLDEDEETNQNDTEVVNEQSAFED